MSNVSLFENDTGGCIGCSLSKDLCSCYGRSNPDHVLLAADSPLIAELLAECRGLQFSNITGSDLSLPSLQSAGFIPIIAGGSKKLFSENHAVPYVGVTLDDALNRAKTHAKPDIRTACGIPADTKIVLLMHGNDVTLGKFAKNQRVIFKELASQDIYLYIAPNFSVWEGHPEIERCINMKFQLVSYDLMNKAGLCTVPHFLWRGDRPQDLQKIADWLNAYPAIGMAAINLQTYQSPEDWQRVTSELQTLYNLIDHPIHFIIVGPTTNDRLADLERILEGNFTLMSALPAILAWSRADIAYSRLRGLRRRVYARMAEGQTELFETDTEPLVLADLFATSSASLDTRISGVRDAEIAGHIKEALSMRTFRRPKTLSRKKPGRRQLTKNVA